MPLISRTLTVLLVGALWVCPVEAQLEGVVTLKEALKEMLQGKGAKSLKKRSLVLDKSEQEAMQKQYGFAPNATYTVYTGLDAEKAPIGSAVVVDIEGKEGPLQLVVALDHTQGAVYNLCFTVFGEERGKPAAKKTFLKQFIGFDTKNEFKLGKDVDGVSGATWTSSSVAEAIQHAVAVFDYFVHAPAAASQGE